jgi:hypothetical protein
MTQGVNIVARNVEHIHVKETDIRRSSSCDLLHHANGMRALNLISENFPCTFIDSRPFVSFHGGVISAGLDVVLHPIGGGRPPDKIEPVLAQIEKNGIANDISLGIARDKLLGLMDLEIPETVHRKVRQQSQSIGALHVEVRHMVRLIEQRAGLAPGQLLVSPIRKFRLDDRKGIRPDL